MEQLDLIREANRRYRTGPNRAQSGTPRPARRLLILTCMDARLDLLPALGLSVGDAHMVRNAGGRATTDALRSIALSTKILGAIEVGVIHHDDCGLLGRTNDDLQEATGAPVDFLPFDDVDGSVIEDVETIRRWPWLADEVTVWGAVYEVEGHRLRVVDPAERGR